MYETAEERAALKTLLEDSYRKAGTHLRSIHSPDIRMSVDELIEQLKGVCILNLATVNSRGQPIVGPVDGLFLGGKFWFGSSEKSLRFKHIRRNSSVSAAHTLGEASCVVVHGTACEIDTSTGDHERLHDYCREAYGPQFDDWGYWGKEPMRG